MTFMGIASTAAVMLAALTLLSAISGPALASVEKGEGGTKFSYNDPEAVCRFPPPARSMDGTQHRTRWKSSNQGYGSSLSNSGRERTNTSS